MSRSSQIQVQTMTWGSAISQGWKIALLCAILCFAVRIAWSYQVRNIAPVADAAGYDSLSRLIAAGDHEAISDIDRAPAYMLFLVGTRLAFGDSPMALLAVQSLVGSIGCAIVVILGLRVARSRTVALLAGVAVALYLPMVQSDCSVLSEVLFGPLALVAILLLDEAYRSGKLWLCLVAGAGVSLAAYTRAESLAVPFIMLIVALWRKAPLRRSLVSFAVICATVFLALLPWSIRNNREFGEFTPLPSSSGVCLAANWNVNTQHRSALVAAYWPPELLQSIEGKNRYQVSRILRQFAIEEIKANPGQYAKSIALKSVRQWTNLFNITRPSKATLVLAPVNLVVLALAIPAFWRRRIDPWFRGYTLLCMALVTALGALVTGAEPRYTFWVLPLIFILAADSLLEIWASRAKRYTEDYQRTAVEQGWLRMPDNREGDFRR